MNAHLCLKRSDTADPKNLTLKEFLNISKLTRPYEADNIFGSYWNAFRSKAIFHGGVNLYNVSSFTHPSNVINIGMLVFGRKKTAWFKNDHVTSVLECSSNLGGI